MRLSTLLSIGALPLWLFGLVGGFPFAQIRQQQQQRTREVVIDNVDNYDYSSLFTALQRGRRAQEQNNDNSTTSSTTVDDEPTGTGNCLCGESAVLLGDEIPPLPADTPNVVPGTTTCADLQSFFADQVACPELSPLVSFCCRQDQGQRPYYECVQQVRRSILTDDNSNENGYDPTTPPIQSINTKPVNVSMHLEYMAVSHVDIAAGTAELFVWLTLQWQDSRLAWTVSGQTGHCATDVYVQAGLDGNSEIWVPDVDLYNRVDGGVRAWERALARVFSDGTVVWIRSGKIRAACDFQNLPQMPYDQLGCQFLWGPQAQFNGIRYDFAPASTTTTSNGSGVGGFGIGGGSSLYTEYRLLPELMDWGIHRDNNALAPSQTIFYNFFFERGRRYYVWNIIVPSTVFAVLSMSSLLFGIALFQRLMFNLTLSLVAVAQQISTSRLLPVTDERIWIYDFVTFSFYWILVVLLVTGFCSAIDNLQQADTEARRTLLPPQSSENKQYHGEEGDMAEEAETSQLERTSARGTRRLNEMIRSRLPMWTRTVAYEDINYCAFASLMFLYVLFLVLMFTLRDQWGSNADIPIVTTEKNPFA